jgi:DNA-binding NtrC family response regulator
MPAAAQKPVAPAKPAAPSKPMAAGAPVGAGKPAAGVVPAPAQKPAAPAAAGAAPSIRSAGSLLVIDPSGVLGKGLERLVTGEATVHSATSVPQAARMLQHQDVAAVIADMSAGKNDLITLFKLLKSKRPQTLSILVSDQPDSEVVVELINQAQVHRLLAKPVNVRELRSHVSEALRRYAAFTQRTRPGIPTSDANRTRPAPAPATTKNPT